MLLQYIKKLVQRHRHQSMIQSIEEGEECFNHMEGRKYHERDTDTPNYDEDEKTRFYQGRENMSPCETIISIGMQNKKMSSTTQISIEKKIDDYIQSFTIHGLTRSVKGKKSESVFWSAMLLAGILCVFIVVYGLIGRYQSHAVYTEVKSQITDKNYFPSITFCEESLLKDAYFSYCGNPIYEPENKTDTRCPQYIPYEEVGTSNESGWTTPLFKVMYCFSWGGKKCKNDKYFMSKSTVNNSCITWNYNGDFHDAYSHVNIEFEFHKPSYLKEEVEVFAIPHDHRILEIDLTKKIELDADHKYEIKIDKTFIKRLPAPFPSNCTNEETSNIFPGRYTRFSCIESHYYVDMYKKCGDVFDYHKPYIPKDIVELYGNTSNADVHSCIVDYSQKELRDLTDCQFACEILDLNYYSTSQARHDKFNNNLTDIYRFDIGIQLKTANEYRVMEEKQLYTLSQMACEIGGFVGLIMGMSVMSLIEVMVIIVLSIAKRIIHVK